MRSKQHESYVDQAILADSNKHSTARTGYIKCLTICTLQEQRSSFTSVVSCWTAVLRLDRGAYGHELPHQPAPVFSPVPLHALIHEVIKC